MPKIHIHAQILFRVVPSLCLALMLSAPAHAQSVSFGNNSSEYSNDGECDDRRFIGPGMATSLDRDDTGHDAADCRRLMDLGMIRVLDEAKARAATQCSAIKFGDNSSDYARDGECDDPRFDGPGSTAILLLDDAGTDARDCSRACDAGTIYLRNY